MEDAAVAAVAAADVWRELLTERGEATIALAHTEHELGLTYDRLYLELSPAQALDRRAPLVRTNPTYDALARERLVAYERVVRAQTRLLVHATARSEEWRELAAYSVAWGELGIDGDGPSLLSLHRRLTVGLRGLGELAHQLGEVDGRIRG